MFLASGENVGPLIVKAAPMDTTVYRVCQSGTRRPQFLVCKCLCRHVCVCERNAKSASGDHCRNLNITNMKIHFRSLHTRRKTHPPAPFHYESILMLTLCLAEISKTCLLRIFYSVSLFKKRNRPANNQSVRKKRSNLLYNQTTKSKGS